MRWRSPPARPDFDPVSWVAPSPPQLVSVGWTAPATAPSASPAEAVSAENVREMIAEMVEEVRTLRSVVRELRGESEADHFAR